MTDTPRPRTRTGESIDDDSARDDRTTWEYHTLRPPREETQKEATDPVEELNRLGAEGWDLVETVDYAGGGTKYLVLKRPAGDGDE